MFSSTAITIIDDIMPYFWKIHSLN